MPQSTPPLPPKFDVHIGPSGPLGGYVDAPPSKNYTTRLILAAALAEGRSLIRNPASNDDALALIASCRALGAAIEPKSEGLSILGVGGKPRNPGVLNPCNAGAVLRLLLGVACLAQGEVRFETDHPDSLGRRPNRELLDALRSLGADARGTGAEETLPISIRAGRDRLRGGEVQIDASRSSQFLSALLFLAPHLAGETRIRVSGDLVSPPLVDQTLDALGRFGARIEPAPDNHSFRIPGGQILRAGEHRVPGDWPSAAALFCCVAAAGGMASVAGLQDDAQGERRIRDALTAMGSRFSISETGATLAHGKGELRAIDFDGDLATDAVLALEGAACLAAGTTRIANIGNLKIKETDRVAEPLAELKKIGVRCESGADWIAIDGDPEGYEGGIDVDCRGDHRIAQMLAIVATRCRAGLTLRGAHCVSKSYPDFFDDLAALGVKVHPLG